MFSKENQRFQKKIVLSTENSETERTILKTCANTSLRNRVESLVQQSCAKSRDNLVQLSRETRVKLAKSLVQFLVKALVQFLMGSSCGAPGRPPNRARTPWAGLGCETSRGTSRETSREIPRVKTWCKHRVITT